MFTVGAFINRSDLFDEDAHFAAEWLDGLLFLDDGLKLFLGFEFIVSISYFSTSVSMFLSLHAVQQTFKHEGKGTLELGCGEGVFVSARGQSSGIL